MPTFEVKGYGRDTGRKRKREYTASTKDEAIRMAGDEGTIVESATEIQGPLASEAQLNMPVTSASPSTRRRHEKKSQQC
jgi:hypothetical protein